MHKMNPKDGQISLFDTFRQDNDLLKNMLVAVPAGIVIVDESGRIVFSNSEMERMFGYRQEEVLGKLVEILLPERFRTIHPVMRRNFLKHPARREMGAERNLWARRKDGSEFPVEVGLGYARGKDEIYVSAVLVDISKRKAIEEEKKLLIDELRGALDKVKLLSGMLPVCANCKKIRDDKGYWNNIESYIRDHSEAEFSHSICPECIKILYPDFS